jgi:hypothetical protein
MLLLCLNDEIILRFKKPEMRIRLKYIFSEL